MPIENNTVKRYFTGPVKKYRRVADYKFIYTLSEEDEYLYHVGRMVETYVTGMLKIRAVLDFWQFQRRLGETFRRDIPAEHVAKAGWDEFVRQIDVLAALWLEEGVRQEYGLALELEEYIIARSQENKQLDKALLPYEKARLDFYWRDRKGEWAARKREWLFPPKDYMFQFFPILGKYPFLLVFCWLIRDLRFVKTVLSNRGRKAWLTIRVRLLDMKEKLCEQLRRKEKEEIEETENTIHINNKET